MDWNMDRRKDQMYGMDAAPSEGLDTSHHGGLPSSPTAQWAHAFTAGLDGQGFLPNTELYEYSNPASSTESRERRAWHCNGHVHASRGAGSLHRHSWGDISYGQPADVFQRQLKPLAIQNDARLQSATQTALSISMGGVSPGTGPILTYSNNADSTTNDTAHPTSSGSSYDTPSDQSSPNENSGSKRKRLGNKENSATGRKPSSSGFIGYTCRVDGCNTTFASKKEVERHQYESLAHEQTYRPKYFCEESRCEKYKEPFTRKDNLRRHIKDMHGDHLP
ncbi:hypothetical protein PG994_013136 [Apiospora phragmitis]|uniref:C2H2-type domain-containing protein n=1 Tax=Apiospora phragmitis TaxID=2905665 RepID=A0ABR1T7U1_9PEZI